MKQYHFIETESHRKLAKCIDGLMKKRDTLMTLFHSKPGRGKSFFLRYSLAPLFDHVLTIKMNESSMDEKSFFTYLRIDYDDEGRQRLDPVPCDFLRTVMNGGQERTLIVLEDVHKTNPVIVETLNGFGDAYEKTITISEGNHGNIPLRNTCIAMTSNLHPKSFLSPEFRDRCYEFDLDNGYLGLFNPVSVMDALEIPDRFKPEIDDLFTVIVPNLREGADCNVRQFQQLIDLIDIGEGEKGFIEAVRDALCIHFGKEDLYFRSNTSADSIFDSFLSKREQGEPFEY
jgi:hypothetical protein